MLNLKTFLKNIQNQKAKLQQQFYSLQLRGVIQKTINLRVKLFQAILLLKSLFNRFFYDIGTLAYAGESHFPNNNKLTNNIDSLIQISNLTLSYDEKSENVLKDINLTVRNSFRSISTFRKSERSSVIIWIINTPGTTG